jgi:hypothetical protein
MSWFYQPLPAAALLVDAPPATGKVFGWDGTAWRPMFVWSGTAWLPVKAWTGTAWI